VICFHDPTLDATTNVESYEWKWGDRKGQNSNYDFDESNTTYNDEYLVHDFTLSEIKSLRLKQRMQYRTQDLNDYF